MIVALSLLRRMGGVICRGESAKAFWALPTCKCTMSTAYGCKCPLRKSNARAEPEHRLCACDACLQAPSWLTPACAPLLGAAGAARTNYRLRDHRPKPHRLHRCCAFAGSLLLSWPHSPGPREGSCDAGMLAGVVLVSLLPCLSAVTVAVVSVCAVLCSAGVARWEVRKRFSDFVQLNAAFRDKQKVGDTHTHLHTHTQIPAAVPPKS